MKSFNYGFDYYEVSIIHQLIIVKFAAIISFFLVGILK